MASLNKVMLIGNLGKDPELKTLPNGDAVCNFPIATSESWKDKSGQRQEKTEWHNITLYRRLAEVAAQYLKKGSSVYIEGKITTRKWQDKNGQDRYTTEIIASQMTMLSSKGGEMPADYTTAPARTSPPPAAAPQAAAARPMAQPRQQARPTYDDIPSDDIPF